MVCVVPSRVVMGMLNALSVDLPPACGVPHMVLEKEVTLCEIGETAAVLISSF